MGFSETRVLKAHKDAVEEAIRTFGRPYADDKEGFHHSLALAVLTATDSTTRYVIVCKDGTGQYIFGPFANYDAAEFAALGHLPVREDSLYMILPLIPTPKVPRRKK
jgi:hypothetical protein